MLLAPACPPRPHQQDRRSRPRRRPRARPDRRPVTAPLYGTLIKRFHYLTGVPVVLNTSYNDREPIVETLAHTLATLEACDLDAACIGEHLVERP
ncbi:carbamoyltransferase C-terminal domain-containing protein [Streptomyces coerulescens]|uniref:Carbamoyltransferase C-terminal domain-containing protein n=1 Tax=Streptomyces coerulescens TaxID=29304 RepID=A0ABW0CVS9_STRCD